MKCICLFLLLSITVCVSQVIEKQAGIRYLALGDSYTIGQSVPTKGRWPNQLRDSLSRIYNLGFDEVHIIATTGWRTDDLMRGIAAEAPDSTWDLVSLLIGVNNFYQGRPVSQYISEFDKLMKWSIALAGGNKEHVFVLSIPDYAYTPFGKGDPAISKGIDLYNGINDSTTAVYGVQYYNITPISRRGLDEPELVANDGLHPSDLQYAYWVQEVLKGVDVQTAGIITVQDRPTAWHIEKGMFHLHNNQMFRVFSVNGRLLMSWTSACKMPAYGNGILLLQTKENKSLKFIVQH